MVWQVASCHAFVYYQIAHLRSSLVNAPCGQVDEGIFFNLRSVKNGIRILEGYNLTYWDTKANNRIYRIQLTSESEEGTCTSKLLTIGHLDVFRKDGSLATSV